MHIIVKLVYIYICIIISCNYLCHYLLKRKMDEHNNQNIIYNNLFNTIVCSEVDGARSEVALMYEKCHLKNRSTCN